MTDSRRASVVGVHHVGRAASISTQDLVDGYEKSRQVLDQCIESTAVSDNHTYEEMVLARTLLRRGYATSVTSSSASLATARQQLYGRSPARNFYPVMHAAQDVGATGTNAGTAIFATLLCGEILALLGVMALAKKDDDA